MYWRVLQDAFHSGFVRGTPVLTAQGIWAVAWQLGGQPLILEIISVASGLISLTGIITIIHYLAKRYHAYKKFRKYCTNPTHPSSFRNSISSKARKVIAVGLILSLIGLAVLVDPKIVAPNAKPSPNYLEDSIHVSLDVVVIVTRFAILNTAPSILDKNNMTGFFYCIISTPEHAFWNVSEINTSSIILNGRLHANSAFIELKQNGATAMVSGFDKSALAFLFQDQAIEQGAVAIRIKGSLENGEFFQGNTSVDIE